MLRKGSLLALAFDGDGRGLLSSERGLWLTRDAGTSWQALDSELAISRLRFDAQQGFLALDRGGVQSLLLSEDQSVLSQRLHGIVPGVLQDFVSEPRLLIVGDGGLLLRREAAQLQPAGAYGTLLRSVDGGLSFVPVTSHTTASLRAVAFLDKSRAVAAGQAGVLRYSDDGGVSWQAPSYRRYPPMLTWLLIATGVLYVLRPISEALREPWRNLRVVRDEHGGGVHLILTSPARPEEDLTPVIVNDAALTGAAGDRLGMAPLARALALFLRNTRTRPPQTIAVTGDWGSGKSSLMGMLKEQLQLARYRPIWFNAWHHHQEEHLFAALLEQIRNDALPPLWQASGLWFRLRLIARRSRRHVAFVLALLTVLLIAWSFRAPSQKP